MINLFVNKMYKSLVVLTILLGLYVETVSLCGSSYTHTHTHTHTHKHSLYRSLPLTADTHSSPQEIGSKYNKHCVYVCVCVCWVQFIQCFPAVVAFPAALTMLDAATTTGMLGE